ncbi:hypothetical protein [Noviherbaspirillum galbum]|uniref:Uncharacterized protein n=1 Tax=Noviherbaspirillum galbum TaxID=2709383 RepID=A0A6B3SMB5_9BURK|nr:hypothetical protein [Noviherbaspirillum galbum]NEX59512.1 hypothetical protein [Noviherbaspirillum galbum]
MQVPRDQAQGNSGNKKTGGYDPVESGATNEVGKQHQADPPMRHLTEEERKRAEEILGRFENGQDSQKD